MCRFLNVVVVVVVTAAADVFVLLQFDQVRDMISFDNGEAVFIITTPPPIKGIYIKPL